jgi:hypothetical protein
LALVVSQFSRTRSAQAVRVMASKLISARRFMLVPVENLLFLMVPMLLESLATLGDNCPKRFCLLVRLRALSNQIEQVINSVGVSFLP